MAHPKFTQGAWIMCLGILSLSFPLKSWATEQADKIPEEASISEQLGKKVDLSLTFRKQNNVETSLAELLLQERPIIIAPVYYDCPRLCKLTMSGITSLINKLRLKLGEDYSIATVSFDPQETPERASQEAAKAFSALDSPPQDPEAWQFLTGEKNNIKQLMESIGFKYKQDKGEFSHAAAFIILSPKGKISRYFYGVNFPSGDVELALVEAAEGKIGSTLHRVMLYCFRFDPTRGQYTLAVLNITRLVGLVGLGILVTALLTLRIREGRNA